MVWSVKQPRSEVNPMAGPQPGAQADVEFCPTCARPLEPIPSRYRPAESSHRYRCPRGHDFEINSLPKMGRETRS